MNSGSEQIESRMPSFQDYLGRISEKYSEYVTPTFLRLDPAKRCAVVLAVCRTAVELADPAQVNIKIVASKAGIAVGSLYKYFPGRQKMMDFTITVIRDYLIQGCRESAGILAGLPLTEALYYYCTGAMEWSHEEQILSRFFYQAAYSGNNSLYRELVQPCACAFLDMIDQILGASVQRGEIALDYPQEEAAVFLYQSITPLADSLIYPDRAHYFFPGGIHLELLKKHIQIMLSGIGTLKQHLNSTKTALKQKGENDDE